MADNTTHLKAVLVLDDLCNESNIQTSRSDCLTLKKFHYRCSCGYDGFRVTGSVTGTSILSLSLKLNTETKIRIFYEYMRRNEPQPFSIIFNAVYDRQGKISSYQDAMTVYGYIVSVNDTYNADVMKGEGRGKIDIDVDVLISSIIYKGTDRNIVISINRNEEK